MTPRIVKFQVEHLAALVNREGGNGEHVERGLKLMKQFPSFAYSAELDGKILGCAGMILLGNDQGYVWVIVSEAIENYRIWFHRSVRNYLRRIIKIAGLKFLHTEVLKCSKRNREWIETLGFKAKPYIIYELVL